MSHKKARSFADIKNDPRVESISDERGRRGDGGDGIWVYLHVGFHSISTGCHCVHEWSVKDLIRDFNDIAPCKPGGVCDCKFGPEPRSVADDLLPDHGLEAVAELI